MAYRNSTVVAEFILLGFPGLHPQYYGPMSILLFFVFLAIVMGNMLVLGCVACERCLQKPTYVIFCHLALTDIMFGTMALPKMICVYWFDDQFISKPLCLTQMYFVHFLSAAHSFILMVMVLDRFIAICVPLRYPVLITNFTISVLCGVSWIMPLVWMIAVTFHVISLTFCGSNLIQQCFCDRVSVMALACDTNLYYEQIGFILAMFSLMVPLSFIIFSNVCIIAAVMRISTSDGRYKTLSTCTPQILILCLFYIPRCSAYTLTFTVGYIFNADVRVTVIMLYSLLPPAVNPIIYCFKTKDIKETLLRRFKKIQTKVSL